MRLHKRSHTQVIAAMVSLEQMQEFEASMKSQFAMLQGPQETSERRVVETLQARL